MYWCNYRNIDLFRITVMVSNMYQVYFLLVWCLYLRDYSMDVSKTYAFYNIHMTPREMRLQINIWGTLTWVKPQYLTNSNIKLINWNRSLWFFPGYVISSRNYCLNTSHIFFKQNSRDINVDLTKMRIFIFKLL